MRVRAEDVNLASTSSGVSAKLDMVCFIHTRVARRYDAEYARILNHPIFKLGRIACTSTRMYA